MADEPAPSDEAGYEPPHQRPESRTEEPEHEDASPDEYVRNDPAPTMPQQPEPPTPRTVILALLAGTAIISLIWVSMHFTWPGVTIAVVSTLAGVQLGLFAIRGPRADAEAAFKAKMATPRRVPARVRKVLAPSERVYVITNDHPLMVAHWMLAIIAIQVITIWLFISSSLLSHGPGTLVVMCLWLAAMVVPVYKLAAWRRTIFVITNKSILLFTGVFTEEHNQMSLAALTDVKAIAPFHSRWLAGMRWIKVKYGTFWLETAGQKQAINAVGMMAGIDALEYILRSLVQGEDPFEDSGDGLPYPVSPSPAI